MRLIRTLHDLPPEARGAAVAIGNFDGVHRGHRGVIARAAAEAGRRGAPLGVVTFDPHPRRFLRPETPAFTLTPLSIKARLLGALGVDFVAALTFDETMAGRSAEDFVGEILARGLGIAHATVGYDFHFGHDRQGTPERLSELGPRAGFSVERVAEVGARGALSSSHVRELLRSGAPRRAAEIMGHWWTIEGEVLTGDQRGRTIAFPTANIAMSGYLVPALGVYAARVHLPDGRRVDGVANIGRRPTFDKTDILLEVHLFDFEGDLYGQILAVDLVDFLRPERKFDGLDALKAQIARDASQARDVLARPENAGEALAITPLARG